jgi:hypothetical protein
MPCKLSDPQSPHAQLLPPLLPLSQHPPALLPVPSPPTLLISPQQTLNNQTRASLVLSATLTLTHTPHTTLSHSHPHTRAPTHTGALAQGTSASASTLMAWGSRRREVFGDLCLLVFPGCRLLQLHIWDSRSRETAPESPLCHSSGPQGPLLTCPLLSPLSLR